MNFTKFFRELHTAPTLLKELIYPRRCSVCAREIEEGIFCEQCRESYLLRKRIRFEPEDVLVQGLPYAAKDILKGAIFLFRYDGIIKDKLHELKFEDKRELLSGIKEEADFALPANLELFLEKFDLLTSIPTSKERLERRGFDIPQEIFAKLFASKKYEPKLLVRARNTLSLFELAPDERRAELAGCFALNPSFTVGGKSVLICDDIYTTGSTLAEAAICLREAGEREVYALTFAAARENWDL